MSEDLLSIAKEFRSGMLGKKSSRGMCFAVCAALAGYLSAAGYEARLVEGSVMMKKGVVRDFWYHCWLALPDGRIIDPTADQFSTKTRKMPKVYIGKLPEWYF